MTTFFTHSVENPPKPSTWRLVWDLHDPEIHFWCPNGHKMKIQGNFHNIALAFAHSCIGDGTTMCDFKDIVYLVSTLPSPMKLSVPRHDAEYNHQPHLGEPTLGTPIEFVADVHNPEDVLRLVVLLNNMLLDTIHLLYLVELAVSNRQGDEKILEICKSRNAYHIN